MIATHAERTRGGGESIPRRLALGGVIPGEGAIGGARHPEPAGCDRGSGPRFGSASSRTAGVPETEQEAGPRQKHKPPGRSAVRHPAAWLPRRPRGWADPRAPPCSGTSGSLTGQSRQGVGQEVWIQPRWSPQIAGSCEMSAPERPPQLAPAGPRCVPARTHLEHRPAQPIRRSGISPRHFAWPPLHVLSKGLIQESRKGRRQGCMQSDSSVSGSSPARSGFSGGSAGSSARGGAALLRPLWSLPGWSSRPKAPNSSRPSPSTSWRTAASGRDPRGSSPGDAWGWPVSPRRRSS